MAMRETVGSLRAYFLLVGGAGLLVNIAPMFAHREKLNAILVGAAVIGSMLAVGYLYMGIRLPDLLTRSPKPIYIILCGSLILQLIVGPLSYYDTPEPKSLILPVLSILIYLYLFVNVKRLSREMQDTPWASGQPRRED